MDSLSSIMDELILSERIMHVPGIRAQRTGLEVLGAGGSGSVPRKGALRRPRVLSCYAVVVHVAGESFFESGACGRARVSEPAAYVLFPGLAHRYGAVEGSGWTETWVTFKGAIPDRLQVEGLLSPHRAVMDLPAGDLRVPGCVQAVHARLSDRRPGYEEEAGAALYRLLMLVVSLGDRVLPESRGGTAIERAVWHLSEHTAETVNVRDLARRVGMGYASFRKRFREQTGHGPHQYHLRLRIQLAQHLLLTTDKTVREVAFAAGFSDPYYFSRLFRRIAGVPPRGYRREMHSWAGGRPAIRGSESANRDG